MPPHSGDFSGSFVLGRNRELTKSVAQRIQAFSDRERRPVASLERIPSLVEGYGETEDASARLRVLVIRRWTGAKAAGANGGGSRPRQRQILEPHAQAAGNGSIDRMRCSGSPQL